MKSAEQADYEEALTIEAIAGVRRSIARVHYDGYSNDSLRMGGKKDRQAIEDRRLHVFTHRELRIFGVQRGRRFYFQIRDHRWPEPLDSAPKFPSAFLAAMAGLDLLEQGVAMTEVGRA